MSKIWQEKRCSKNKVKVWHKADGTVRFSELESLDFIVEVNSDWFRLNYEPVKQLTQEVFELPDCPDWADWVAVDPDTTLWAYRRKPQIVIEDKRWHSTNKTPVLIGKGYDTTNWQNSAINRGE